MRSAKPERLLGLDISSTSVKLLELSGRAHACQVESYGVEPLPEEAVVEKSIEDVASVGAAIRRLVARCGARARHAAVAVAGSTVITKTIEMPAGLSEEELEAQLQVEAEQHLPYPLTELALDFAVRGPSPRRQGQVEVLLAAARRGNVEMRRAAVESAGLRASLVDIEAHCIARAFGMMRKGFAPGEDGRPPVIAIADIGATMTLLLLVTGEGAASAREQLFGGRQLTDAIQRRYGLSFEEAGRAKKQGGLPDDYQAEVLAPFQEALVQQVARSLQFFQSSGAGGQVDQIVLAGGTASMDGMAALVAARLKRPCTLANPFADMAMAPGVNRPGLLKDAPAMMIACGLALRGLAE